MVAISIVMIGAWLAWIAWMCAENSVCTCTKCKRRQPCPVIQIEDSPPPSKTPSSPFAPTPKLSSRTHRAVRRGGMRRAHHKRAVTTMHNPHQKHHCGYACLLKAASKRPTLSAIRLLRKAVAEQLREDYMHDKVYMGRRVRDIVENYDENIDKYAHATERLQWASLIELNIGANILHTGFYVDMNGEMGKIGDNPACKVISLKKGHYTLEKLYKYKQRKGGKEEARGGMWRGWRWMARPQEEEARDAQWQQHGRQEDHQVPPQWAWSVPQEKEETKMNLHVRIGSSVRSDIQECTLLLPNRISVGAVKVRIADIVGIDKTRIVLADETTPEKALPDWVECPERILVEDILLLPEKEADYINVFVPAIQQSFIIKVPKDACTGELRETIAKILRVDHRDIKITGRDGKDWTYRTSRSMTSSVVVTVESRGRMQEQDRDMHERDGGSRSRSPTARTQLSPTIPWQPSFGPHSDSGSTNSPEPSRRYQTDRVFPDEAVDPQQLSYPEAVAIAGGLVTTPSPRRRTAEEEDVAGLSPRRHLWSRVWPESPPPAQPNRFPRPLRIGQRTAGMVHAAEGATVGEIVTEVETEINPLAPMTWQPRGVRYWADVDHLYVPAPPPIVCLHPVDLRRPPWEPYQPTRTVPAIVRGQTTCTVLLPRDLDLQLAARRVFQASQIESIWQLIALLWDSWIVHSMRVPDETVAMMEEVNQLRERLSREGPCERKGFKHEENMVMGNYKGSDKYDAYYVIESKYGHGWCEKNVYHVKIYVMCVKDKLGKLPRGGMPRERMDPKSAMIGWALDKASREAPECRAATMTMLCKAEMRTVTALLNSRSRAQTRQVLEAAYRRCDLPSPFQKQQEQPQQQQQQQEQQAFPAADPQLGHMHECLHNMVASLTAQTQMMASISQDINCLPNALQLQNILDIYANNQHTNIQAMRGLTQAIENLERKVEQLQHGQTPVPTECPPTPGVADGDQQTAEDTTAIVLRELVPDESVIHVPSGSEQGHEEQEQGMTEGHEEQLPSEEQASQPMSHSPVLEALATRSQEAQERRARGAAMHPFRASHSLESRHRPPLTYPFLPSMCLLLQGDWS